MMQGEMKGTGIMDVPNERQIADPLTERELDVLQLIGAGLSNQAIAAHLTLTLHTVKWYVKQIYRKLQVTSRAQAAVWARELGLLHRHDALLNLPAPITPFIGREQELRQLEAHLADEAVRQFTILGPGGIGKTRLALEVARRSLTQFQHGVWIVALAGISSPAHLFPAIADAIGFRFYSSHDPAGQLLNYLRGKNMLLLLDNFEHLLEGASRVTDILVTAPAIKILATSRQRLNLQGERLVVLGGLDYPQGQAGENIAEYSAVQLFLERAGRVRPDTQPASDDWGPIAHICRLVEGFPLAIELAAAWTATLSPDQVMVEIERSPHFLQAETRDVPDRHRSMHAVFDHSYSLLDGEERMVFRRLSVFRDGFTAEAAQQVTGASLKTMSSLHGASLVSPEGRDRYRLHELLRQYGAAKLAEDEAEATAAHAEHGRYYLAHAGEWAQQLKAGDQQDGLRKIAQEFENIRHAWNWAVRHRNLSELNAAIGVWFYFEIRGLHQEGCELFGAAIDAVGDEDPLVLGRLLAARSVFAFRLGEFTESEALSRQSIALLEGAGAHGDIGLPLLNLGNVVRFQHGLQPARQLYEQAHHLACDVGDEWSRICALDNLASVAIEMGHTAEARDNLREGAQIRRARGDLWGLTINLANQAECARLQGETMEAKELYEEVLAVAHRIDQPMLVAGALSGLGELALNAGDYGLAQTYYHQAGAINEQIGHRQEIVSGQTALARAYSRRGDLEAARLCACSAMRVALDLDSDQLLLLALAGLCDGVLLAQQPELGVRLLAMVDQHPQVTENVRAIYSGALNTLRQQLNSGDFAAAWSRGTGLDLRATVATFLEDCLPS